MSKITLALTPQHLAMLKVALTIQKHFYNKKFLIHPPAREDTQARIDTCAELQLLLSKAELTGMSTSELLDIIHNR